MQGEGCGRFKSRAGWTISVFFLVSGCARQMPMVSSFMAPNVVRYEISGTAMRGGRTFFVDGSTYGCAPFADTTGGRGDLLSCSESNGTGLHRYDEPPFRPGVSLYLGDSWRFGADGGSKSGVAGWRNPKWGLMAWLNPPHGLEWGAACARQWSPADWLRLGTFGYYATHSYNEWYSKIPGSFPIYRDINELGTGGWVNLGKSFDASLESKIGWEVGRDRFRFYLALNVGWGVTYDQLFPPPPPKPPEIPPEVQGALLE
jgi:hypothetical protein